MKAMLYGSGDQEPQTEMVAQLAQELYSSDMLLQLVDNLHRLDFEVSCMGRGCHAGAQVEHAYTHTHTHTHTHVCVCVCSCTIITNAQDLRQRSKQTDAPKHTRRLFLLLHDGGMRS